MKVSKQWLKQLVNYSVSEEELINLFNHKTIGTKEVTPEFIELDMKGYNRADLLSLRGVAFEVAALTDSKLFFTELMDSQMYWVEKQLNQLAVEVENDQMSPLYCLVKIENLKVENSPEDWKQKLAASGIRSVNNVADVTNLIMLEYGQPLHAFDASMISDEKIIVRQAKKGEKLNTLDSKERELTAGDIVIADPEKVVGLAGVMGGKNSEITETTTTVLLEAAIFDPVTLRKTASRLGLSSEASKRFYHGLKAKRLFQSLNAAIRMYENLGGKVTGMRIVGETTDQLKTIPLRLSKINSLIGENLTAEKVEELLKKLHFILEDKVISGEQISWVVTVPYFRLDIDLEEDLIEEVARMYGYEKIKSQKADDIKTAEIDQTKFNFLRSLGENAAKTGLTEISSYPYYSTKILQSLGWNTENTHFLLKIKNPISKETEFLRQSVWPNLIEVIDKNVRQGYTDIAIFEIGKAYYFDEKGSPKESYRLAVALMNGSENPMAELNLILQKLNKDLKLGLEVKAEKPGDIAKYFVHPTRYTEIFKEDKQIGGFSEVHKRVMDGFGVDKRVAIFEVDLTSFVE